VIIAFVAGCFFLVSLLIYCALDDGKFHKRVQKDIINLQNQSLRLHDDQVTLKMDISDIHNKIQLLESAVRTADQLAHKANISLAQSTAKELQRDDAQEFIHRVMLEIQEPKKITTEQRKLLQKTTKQIKALSR
jgi:hypothetical protein